MNVESACTLEAVWSVVGRPDVEVEGERLEGELAALKAQLDTLDREGPEGGRRGSESEGDEILYGTPQRAWLCILEAY